MKNFLSKRMSKYIIAFLGLIILLAVTTVKPLYVLSFGDEIYLEAAGYDPIDPFKGEYVRVGYGNDLIPKELMSAELLAMDPDMFYREIDDRKLYVELEKVGEFHTVKSVGLEKPDGLFIRASYEWANWTYDDEVNDYDAIIVSYDLDRFYVPEGTGLDLENAIREGKAYSVIKIKNGYGVLTDLRIK